MTTCCPVCHQPINEIRLGAQMTPLKAAIVDRIKAAGDLGVTTTEIIGEVYRDRSPIDPTTIKAHMSQINDLLSLPIGSSAAIVGDGSYSGASYESDYSSRRA
jgi:hypothetical protein